MRIAIIGAGVAGLATIKQITKSIPDVTVVAFDIGQDIGGTWKYTDEVGVDQHGVALTTSMYKNLRTNLPKQVMQFSDFLIPNKNKTFMTQADFYAYLQNYANEFDLKKYIKFEHMIVLVKPRNDQWEVTYKNLKTDVVTTEEFDYVFVCNGHYNKQVVLDFKGKDTFKGSQIHSGQYRKPECYSGKNVLIIGSGPSGLDISTDVAKFAKKVILSHHWDHFVTPFPPNHVQKPDVKEFIEDAVIFVDESIEKIDAIIHCTGYSYFCPFLDPDCGIKIERTHISFLYRHIVNIYYPSMFFIGVPQLCCAVPMMEFQAKYAVAAILGNFELPSQQKMLEHTINDYEMKDKSEFKVARVATHFMGPYEESYCIETSEESGVSSFPPVYCALRYSAMVTSSTNLYTFREHDYLILDDRNFELVPMQELADKGKILESDIVDIVEGVQKIASTNR